MHVSALISSSYKGTGYIGLGSTLMASFMLIASLRELSTNKSHSEEPGNTFFELTFPRWFLSVFF